MKRLKTLKITKAILVCFMVHYGFSQNKAIDSSEARQKNKPSKTNSVQKLVLHNGLVRFGFIGRPTSVGEDIFKTYENALKPFKKRLNNKQTSLKELYKKGVMSANYVTIDRASIYDNENGGLAVTLGFHNIKYNNYHLKRWLGERKSYNSKIRNLGFRGTIFAFSTQRTTNRNDFVYIAKKDYELNVDEYNFIVLFKIPLEEVKEKLKEGRLFIVRKIQLDKSLNFHIVSPIIEIYADSELKTKIGELNYNDLIFY